MSIKIHFDGPLDIATGKTRHEIRWKNKPTTWQALVEKLSTTHTTAEKQAEYLAASVVRQAEIKDIGGFVGGFVSNGRRKKGSVPQRQVVTLDADNNPFDLWDGYTMMYANAGCLYSTHKHSKETPRYRLIIPLDREVLADEYEPIARAIADVLGIEQFDSTTYQTERLMYWPSTSKDGIYEFQYQDGTWLNADNILASYKNWRDCSQWPVSDRETKKTLRDMKKAGDPLEKPGIVGAFCRRFSISEAIETYLSDVYSVCDMDDRYTYAEGSTAGGLVVYEDKFAYSHHGTDPASMKLCNAFDLVRLHLYGLQDDDKVYNKVTDSPSHKAMETLAQKDKGVRAMLVNEKLSQSQEDFANIEDESESTTPEANTEEWKELLDVDKKGNILSTVDNAVIVIQNAPELKGCFAFDEFKQRAVLHRNTPWRKVTKRTRDVSDKDEDLLYHHLEKHYGINANKLEKALNVVYMHNTVHPVREYLGKQKWDGIARAEDLFIDYLGAADTKYTKAVTRKMLVAAVARIYEPGIKFDYVVALLGEEGKHKSTIFAKLAGDWFSDSFNFSMIKDKRGAEQLQGFWIVEVGEMAGFSKQSKNEIKTFLSASEDTFRPAYGRNTVTLPRQGIIVTTSNEDDPLQENDGNRRFWPVRILVDEPTKSVSKDLTAFEVGQIWAEAVTLYKAGEKVYLSAEMERIARSVQRMHTEEHAWAGVIRQYLDTTLPNEWADMSVYERRGYLETDILTMVGDNVRDRVCVQEIWCEALKRDIKDLTQGVHREIQSVMRSMDDWQESNRQLRFGAYGPQRRAYILKESKNVEA